MAVEQRIRSFIAAHEHDITTTLADLVAIPTVNPPGEAYGECVQYVSRLLDAWGVDYQVITVPDGSRPRLSILASYGPQDAPGTGHDAPAPGTGLHFHGHYDVVSAQSPDQFQAATRDGKLFGRGTADMKGGIVAMLFALRALQESGLALTRRLTLTLVPDEETGGRLGIRHLAAEGVLPRPVFGVLMPEPSSGVVWTACRGCLTVRVRVKGRPAHGALAHHGINAFEGMVGVMNDLLALKREVVARRTAMAITPAEAAGSVMLLGGASGSGADFNVVPETAWFSIERRLNPEETLAGAKEELERVFDRHRAKGLGIEVETFQEGDALVTDAGADLGRTLGQAVGEVTGAPARFELCPGVLETRFFNAPGYGYSPGLLAISHGPQEYVELRALFACTAIYALTAARLLGRPL